MKNILKHWLFGVNHWTPRDVFLFKVLWRLLRFNFELFTLNSRLAQTELFFSCVMPYSASIKTKIKSFPRRIFFNEFQRWWNRDSSLVTKFFMIYDLAVACELLTLSANVMGIWNKCESCWQNSWFFLECQNINRWLWKAIKDRPRPMSNITVLKLPRRIFFHLNCLPFLWVSFGLQH